MTDDIELMQRFKTGDSVAAALFVQKYEKDVFNFAMRMSKTRQEAEDLAQETFVRAISSAKNYYPGAKVTTWLYKIASNLAIDRSRRHMFKNEINETDTQFENEGAEPKHEAPDTKTESADAHMLHEEHFAKIKSAVLSLPARQKAAIILLLYEEKSYAEISEILGVSIGAVETLIFRARQELKNTLKDIK